MNKIKNINNKITESLDKFTSFLVSKGQKNTRRKIYNSLWAVFLGLIISAIFISFLSINPFSVYSELLSTSIFSNFEASRSQFSIILAILIIASIAMAIGFKSGLFNIGVPGQMMTSGAVGMLIILNFQNNGTNINAGILILAIVIGIVTATLVGIFVGLIKAFLNVHEVVTTILLNWVIVYIASFLFTSRASSFAKSDTTGSIEIANAQSFNYINTWWIWLIIALIIVGIAWLIMSKTTIGYRLKVNGLSKEASKYSGTNEKSITVITMAISSALAGLAGSIYYISFVGWFVNSAQPLLLGFHTIAISLLAYNSPIGLVFSSLLYGTLETGNIQLLGISNQAKEIVGGIIIYLAALSNMFFQFRFLSLIKNYYFLITSKEFWVLLKAYIKESKNRKQIYKNDLSTVKKELEPYKIEIKQIKQKMKLLTNGISPDLNILEVKTANQSLDYFENISKNKVLLKERLNEINYFEIEKIKISKKAQSALQKEQFKKEYKDIYERKTLIFVTMISKKWNQVFKKAGK